MRDFEFLEPTTVPEASRLLADLGDDCRAIAGGTALVLALRQRVVNVSHLVSLTRIDALRGITFDMTHGLRIGALTLHADVATSPLVQQHSPMLARMAAHMANPQVRNQGTLAGNLCYADPATDPPGCLMALGASVVLQGQGGERVLGIEEFLVDYYTTALAPDELLTEIRVPPSSANSSSRYTRFLRTAAEHRPLVTLAMQVQREGAQCTQARLVVAASTAVPTRAKRAETLLCSQSLNATTAPGFFAEVADVMASDMDVISDHRGSETHRREMVRVMARRSLTELFLGTAT